MLSATWGKGCFWLHSPGYEQWLYPISEQDLCLPRFFRSDVAGETNLIFSEVVTLIMEHKIQSHFSRSVHREIFSLNYNPRVFFQRMRSLPKKWNVIFLKIWSYIWRSQFLKTMLILLLLKIWIASLIAIYKKVCYFCFKHYFLRRSWANNTADSEALLHLYILHSCFQEIYL